jgi:hypothetical protein
MLGRSPAGTDAGSNEGSERMKISALALAVAGVLAAGTAQASFAYVDNAAPARQEFQVLAGNDFRSQLNAAGVTSFSLGAALGVSAPGSITVDYFGKEAVFSNSFQWAGQSLRTTPAPLVDPWSQRTLGTFSVGSGVLNYAFCTDGGQVAGPAVPPTCYPNANEDTTPIGTLVSIGISIVTPTTAWLLFDDGGAGPDDNHDDMVIRLTYRATPVPEPATLGLLGVGLVGAGVVARRRVRG